MATRQAAPHPCATVSELYMYILEVKQYPHRAVATRCQVWHGLWYHTISCTYNTLPMCSFENVTSYFTPQYQWYLGGWDLKSQRQL